MSAVKSRREQYSEATRSALLATATALFAERGYAKTSLEDIAAATQVTRGAVYHHFASKQALFEAVLAEQETTVVRRSEEAAAAAPDPVGAAVASLHSFLLSCLDPVYGQIVMREGPVALGFARWQECEQAFALGHIEERVRALIEAGELLPVSGPLTARLVFALLGAAGMAINDAPDPDRVEVMERAEQVIAAMLLGLRRPT